MKKQLLKIFLFIFFIFFITYFIFFQKDKIQAPSSGKPNFITEDGGLYAHAKCGAKSQDAWVCWDFYSGVNSDSESKYIFLPISADDKKAEIYNNYDNTVTVGNKKIHSRKSAIIDYTEGEKIPVETTNGLYYLIIYKSDAEASVFVNDTKGIYNNYEGKEINSDLYSFLLQDKRNYAQNSNCAIVDKNGIGYFEGLGDTLNCVDDEEKILEQVNKMLNQVKRMDLTKKKKKMRMRMNKLKKDFQ